MELRYTKDHLWGKFESAGIFKFGLSEFAQEELGEVVYVELPKEGNKVTSGTSLCVIESLKSVSELYSPCDGTITSANKKLILNQGCQLINTDPLGEGWIFAIRFENPEDFATLLSAEEYSNLVAE